MDEKKDAVKYRMSEDDQISTVPVQANISTATAIFVTVLLEKSEVQTIRVELKPREKEVGQESVKRNATIEATRPPSNVGENSKKAKISLEDGEQPKEKEDRQESGEKNATNEAAQASSKLEENSKKDKKASSKLGENSKNKIKKEVGDTNNEPSIAYRVKAEYRGGPDEDTAEMDTSIFTCDTFEEFSEKLPLKHKLPDYKSNALKDFISGWVENLVESDYGELLEKERNFTLIIAPIEGDSTLTCFKKLRDSPANVIKSTKVLMTTPLYLTTVLCSQKITRCIERSYFGMRRERSRLSSSQGFWRWIGKRMVV